MNLNPRRFKSRLMASDFLVRAGTCCMFRRRFRIGLPPVKCQIYRSKRPNSFWISRNALARSREPDSADQAQRRFNRALPAGLVIFGALVYPLPDYLDLAVSQRCLVLGHVNARVPLAFQQQNQRAADMGTGDDDRAEFGALHHGIVVLHAKSALDISLGSGFMTGQAVFTQYRIHILLEADVSGAASAKGN